MTINKVKPEEVVDGNFYIFQTHRAHVALGHAGMRMGVLYLIELVYSDHEDEDVYLPKDCLDIREVDL